MDFLMCSYENQIFGDTVAKMDRSRLLALIGTKVPLRNCVYTKSIDQTGAPQPSHLQLGAPEDRTCHGDAAKPLTSILGNPIATQTINTKNERINRWTMEIRYHVIPKVRIATTV